MVNVPLYMASSGCRLPKEFPLVSTVQRYLQPWRASGLWWPINHTLVMAARELEERVASPTAGIVVSQRGKTTGSGGPRGFDAGKPIKRRKRHIVTETLGLNVGIKVHSADIQDRDGVPGLMHAISVAWSWLRHVFADGAYAGPRLQGRWQNRANGQCRS